MNKQQENALRKNVSSSKPEVNQILTEKREPNADILVLDSLFATLGEPKTLYRLLPNDYVTIEDKSYNDSGSMSCSDDLDSLIAHFSSHNLCCFIINAPSRTSVIDVNSLMDEGVDESEYILQRGTTLTINSTKSYLTDYDLQNFIDKYDLYSRINEFKDVYHIERVIVYECSINNN